MYMMYSGDKKPEGAKPNTMREAFNSAYQKQAAKKEKPKKKNALKTAAGTPQGSGENA